MDKPLLSIVVPTKDRYKYLKYLIDYIIELKNPQIEFVIQDNTADNNEIIEFLSGKSFENIKYFHHKEPISICENSDKAVLNSTGEYICYIGDDDAFLPQIMDAVNIMKNNNIDAINPNRLLYFWPDVPIESIYKTSCYVRIQSGKLTKVNQLEELKKCLDSAGYDIVNLPHIYHGIIRRSFLDKLYKKCGTYFPGPSPDMANAVALSLIEGNIYKLDYPLIIAGTGFKRIENNIRGDNQDLENCDFLPADTIENWNNQIPKRWTVPTIYAQTIFITLRKMGREDLWGRFNLKMMMKRFEDVHNRVKKEESLSFRIKDQIKRYLPNLILKLLNRRRLPQNIPDVITFSQKIGTALQLKELL